MPEKNDPAANGETPAGWRRWGRRLLAAYLSFHALAILDTLVPDWGVLAKTIRWIKGDGLSEEKEAYLAELDKRGTAIPPRRPFDGLFFFYRVLTGTRQDWQMFHTSPRDWNLEVELLAKDDKGNTHTLGAMFPGFSAVDVRHKGRHYHLWARYEFWNEQAYINTYLENAGTILKKSRDPYYVDLTLVIRKHLINKLEKIRETGEIATVDSREFWLPRDVWKD